MAALDECFEAIQFDIVHRANWATLTLEDSTGIASKIVVLEGRSSSSARGGSP